MNFRKQIINLPFHWAYADVRIKQSGRTNQLFRNPRRYLPLKVSGRGTGENNLVHMAVEFLKIERPVIIGAGKAEAVINQALLPRVVPAEHAVNLRQGNVGFINKQQKILGKVIQQRIRHGARFPARQHTAVVFNTGAKPGFP